ncbi:MAG: LysE family translocator [Cellvibrionaceae bacterium]
MELVSFILVSMAIIIIPGPNVLVIVSTSITGGRVRGLQTVAGTSVAMAIQLGIAAIGTASFVAVLTNGLLWLKWVGVAYLVYLGIDHLRRLRTRSHAPATALGSFRRGFWISLTNPKTILFFSAFLPQFASASESFLWQVAQLSAIFWLLAVALDSGYALLASRIAGFVEHSALLKYHNGVSGLLYLAAGALLAGTRSGQ